MSGIVEYSRLYKTACLIIVIFIFLLGIFIIFCGNQPFFGLAFLIIDIPFILLAIYLFTFILSFNSEKITIKSAFRKYTEIPVSEIITYYYNKITYYGGNILVIKTNKGRIFISSDCENMDNLRNFLIKYCPAYVKY